ncbi:MAG TPA: hypothetical protein VFH39_00120 [Candidatus Saccharimonadales bacterium]|nr:hypothetical protein [Candidatus Saccharimonadales bacterium]
MAVAAESQQQRWQLARDAFPEAEYEAERKLTAYIGSIAVRGEHQLHSPPEDDNESTLLHAVQLAALGDTDSRYVVETCVRTDYSERLYKVANRSRVELSFIGNELWQQGRSLQSIHGNTLRHMHLTPEMLKRTMLETRNAGLFGELYARGALQDHAAVVFSTTSTKMSQTEKKDYNFFLDTETCSIQLLTADGAAATLETALVAGKSMPSGERHDLNTINKLSRGQGIAIHENDGTDMLRHVMLIPKTAVPNGVIDVVRMYDDAAGGTFYGQAQPRQDYISHARACEQRNRLFDNTVQQITEQLIREAAHFKTPIEAIERLDFLSERHGVRQAVHDTSIDARVFGAAAVMHIEEARFFAAQGDTERADRSMRAAQKVASSGSCPIFKGAERSSQTDDVDNQSSQEESSGKKVMSCPFCSAKVYDDPCASVLTCWDCRAQVVNGRVVNKGNGGRKAREARKAAEAARKAEHKKHGEAALGEQVDAVFEERGLEFPTEPEVKPVKAAAQLAVAAAQSH